MKRPIETEMRLAMLARHLARNAVKNKWKEAGRRPYDFDLVELNNAASAYLVEHRTRLRAEALAILGRMS